MTKELLTPDYIFESSWEVCNKVGGIYTVLSTRANTLQAKFHDRLFFIGPDFWQGKENPLFIESDNLCAAWRKHAAEQDNLSVRVGRWNIPGNPIVILVDFQPFFALKNDIYTEMWNRYQVDSLHAYGDYDEASMFSYAAGKVVESFYRYNLTETDKVIYQAHEWMTGMGALYLQTAVPEIATIFTTHATSIGRSIAGNNKPLYDYLFAYNGDQMAEELNMQSKHSIEKQTAIIVLMAQIGCFVPAEYAKIGVVDKIFTRVGASDDLTSGQSTFMVEMNEVAEILKNATKKSLVILDEIGRGTSTFDGISIAKAVAEYISGKAIGCKTLFATHYHELISMEKEYDGIRNFSVAAVKRGDELRFLHKICEGGTDDSYGIEVAKLAGLPQKVINRAKEELVELEKLGRTKLSETIEKTADHQFSFTAINEQNAIAKLRAADINTMSPMDALMFLKDIKDTL